VNVNKCTNFSDCVCTNACCMPGTARARRRFAPELQQPGGLDPALLCCLWQWQCYRLYALTSIMCWFQSSHARRIQRTDVPPVPAVYTHPDPQGQLQVGCQLPSNLLCSLLVHMLAHHFTPNDPSVTTAQVVGALGASPLT